MSTAFIFEHTAVKPKTFYQDIDPSLAEQYLKSNKDNRTLHSKWVNEYAFDMKRGLWKTSHQGIAFDEDGNLVDGQHRLAAIIKSGVTVRLQVTTNLDRESVLAVDRGRNRTYDEAKQMLGEKLPPKYTMTLRSMFLPTTAGQHAFSHGTLDDLSAKYKDAVLFSLDCFNKPCEAQLRVATIMGVVARAFYTANLSRIREFVDVLASGVIVDTKDIAAVKLRTFRFTNPIGGGSSRAELYKKTESALQSFLAGKPIDKLYSVNDELFPIPG